MAARARGVSNVRPPLEHTTAARNTSHMTRFGIFISTAIALLGAMSPTAFAQINLTDGDGFLWDIRDTGYGDVDNGTSDAYDRWPRLCVTTRLTIAASDECMATEVYDAAGAASTTGLAGREIVTAPVTIAGLSVSRRIYVPDTAGDGWARYLEVLTNPGATPITVRVRVGSVHNVDNPDLGSDGSTTIIATSDATGTLGPGLYWFTSDDTDASGDPSLGHMMDGAGRADVTSIVQDAFALGADGIFWEYGDITVPAGGTAMVMYFLTQQANQADAATVTTGLATASASTLVGITSVAEIANWSFAVCGNSTVEPGEECDDGNIDDTDACTATCQNAICGDGSIQAGVEACDDGTANSDTDVDACRTDCTPASCGDAVVDTGEMCDDGNLDDTDACTNACAPATCGDAIVQAGTEECDDGNADDADACTNACTNAVCGDGLVYTGIEECDDGTANSDTDLDACRTDCAAASCGDAVVDTGETCDEGASNGTGPGNCLADCSAIEMAMPDAGTGTDAGGTGTDAGSISGDAGVGIDAGTVTRDDGGCGCKVGPGAPTGSGGALALLALGVLGLIARRRRG